MTFVYIVRCNFTAPEKEQAWNSWYSGPKLKQMLTQPYFLSGQRFRRATGTGRDYLALWTVEAPEALRTTQYKSQWGFAEWTPYITAWSRDLFDGGAAAASDFAVARDAGLEVIPFDGMTAMDANAARLRIAAPTMMWLPVAGLDRHTPVIGIRTLPAPVAASGEAAGASIQHAAYRPICDCLTAAD